MARHLLCGITLLPSSSGTPKDGHSLFLWHRIVKGSIFYAFWSFEKSVPFLTLSAFSQYNNIPQLIYCCLERYGSHASQHEALGAIACFIWILWRCQVRLQIQEHCNTFLRLNRWITIFMDWLEKPVHAQNIMQYKKIILLSRFSSYLEKTFPPPTTHASRDWYNSFHSPEMDQSACSHSVSSWN